MLDQRLKSDIELYRSQSTPNILGENTNVNPTNGAYQKAMLEIVWSLDRFCYNQLALLKALKKCTPLPLGRAGDLV